MTLDSSEVAASRPVQAVNVRALKFDGRVHREWQARLVARHDSLVVVAGVFEEEIRHPLLGRIARGTESVEYYWTDRWYSVFRFSEASGSLRNYYCNINQPAKFDGRVLSFVDLDIDVLVAPDLSYRVLDEEEFILHAARYDYPASVRETVPRALAELIDLIERRDYPFESRA